LSFLLFLFFSRDALRAKQEEEEEEEDFLISQRRLSCFHFKIERQQQQNEQEADA
jgi:hypothetical protein